MLDLGRYLLGVAELGLLAGFALLGAAQLRRLLLPDFSGAPAHLATTVLALAILIWTAELLGTFGLFEAVPYLVGVAVVGVGTRALGRGSCRRGGAPRRPSALLRAKGPFACRVGTLPSAASGSGESPHPDTTRGRSVSILAPIAVAIAAVAVVHFADGVRVRLGTGMTGFDSTWYHGPFAGGFFQSGDTWDLHFIAPQFLAWFYPANSELVHAVGMVAFDRDVLSPLLNLGWLVGCLVAVWCIGRPFGVAPFSLALGAIALSVPALSDQAGEARNDIVGIFFLLAAVAVVLNAWAGRTDDARGLPAGALIVAGLAAGLAAGTKLNFLLPAAVLVVGLALIAPSGGRWRAFAATGLAALAGGGYWYLRNLVHTGNPLPWVKDIGPISSPAPQQALGGREGRGVLSYLTDGAVWSDWFLPGLRDGLWVVWPLLVALAFACFLLCLGRRGGPSLRVIGTTGLAAVLVWLIAPASASGPEGMPLGFESGLRYLAPALVLGLALLPAAPPLRARIARLAVPRSSSHFVSQSETKCELTDSLGLASRSAIALGAVLVVLLAIACGYPVQRHYLEHRYSDPSFTTPGLNAAFEWARSLSNARIATTSTRQYPLFGTDLSNHVDFIGIERPHGGFTAPTTCRTWREAVNAGDYDYVIATHDRLEPGKPTYPPTARWTEAPTATAILRIPPTTIFKLKGPLDPSACH